MNDLQTLGRLSALSCAILAYELWLTRLCAFVVGHEATYFIVVLGLAGAGLGASLAARAPLEQRPEGSEVGGPALAVLAATVTASYVLPSLEVGPHVSAVLLALLALAYFGVAGFAVARQYQTRLAEPAASVASDVVGAALGVVMLLAVLHWGDFAHATVVPLAVLLALAWLQSAGKPGVVVIGLATAVVVALVPQHQLAPTSATPLWARLHAEGDQRGERIATRWGLEGRVDHVDVPKLGVEELYLDGAAPALLVRDADSREVQAAHRRDLPYLPMALARPRTVLALGAGAGYDAWLARLGGAQEVTHVEVSDTLLSLAYPRTDTSAAVLRQPGVRVVVEEARRFLARDTRTYELVTMALLQGQSDARRGLALREARLYTVEAVREMAARLTPEGRLAFFFHDEAHLWRMERTVRGVLGEVATLWTFEHAASAPHRYLLYAALGQPRSAENAHRQWVLGEGRLRGVTRPASATHAPTHDDRPTFFHTEGSPSSPLWALALLGLLLGAVWVVRVWPADDDAAPHGLRAGRVLALAAGFAFVQVELLLLDRATADLGNAGLALGLCAGALMLGLAARSISPWGRGNNALLVSLCAAAVTVCAMAHSFASVHTRDLAVWASGLCWGAAALWLGVLHGGLMPRVLQGALALPSETAHRLGCAAWGHLAGGVAYTALTLDFGYGAVGVTIALAYALAAGVLWRGAPEASSLPGVAER